MIYTHAKIIMLGDNCVGKTCLVDRFLNEKFNSLMTYRSTVALAYSAKEVEIDNRKIVLGLWDTAGSERYRAMVSLYYRGAKAAVICFDALKQDTFNHAKSWVRELRANEEGCKIYLCATKSDLVEEDDESKFNLDKAQIYARSIQAQFFITSSKTGENVHAMFNEIAKGIISELSRPQTPRDSLVLTIEPIKRRRCCPSFISRK